MKFFLRNPNDVYILYFHYWLSEAGLLEFSLTKLLPSMCASSEAVTTIKKAMKKWWNTTTQQSNAKTDQEIKQWDGKCYFYITNRKKDEWQERIMELELKVLEMDSVT